MTPHPPKASQSPKSSKPLLAIDIDDVVAGFVEHVRLWANDHVGIALTPEDYNTNDDYWDYFNSIWRRNGLSDRLNINMYLEAQVVDQSGIPIIEGARETIQALKAKYDLLFLTARPSYQKDATRAWLDERIDSSIPLYMALNPHIDNGARSKGEICAELGVSMLIDDHADHCQSAITHGVDAILFGAYGWNEHAPKHLRRCASWAEVGEALLNEA